jgi:hypothetical protein
MINKEKLRKVLEDRTFHTRVKKFVLESLRGFYTYPSSNKTMVLRSLDIIEIDKLDDEYFIDFDYLNTLDVPLIDYYLNLLTVTDEHPSAPNMRLMLDSGVLITGLQLLKRKRVEKLNEVEKRKIYDSDDDLFGMYDDD